MNKPNEVRGSTGVILVTNIFTACRRQSAFPEGDGHVTISEILDTCYGTLLYMGQTSSKVETTQTTNSSISSCPVPHSSITSSAPTTCPIDQKTESAAAQCPSNQGCHFNSKPAQCPIEHNSVNPLNQIPDLSQAKQENQKIDLPLDRTVSSIPRDAKAKWEYPSPQQFYNALVRKGWETPEEHVVTMVEIHNFLNEEAWEEVKKWEKRRAKRV